VVLAQRPFAKTMHFALHLAPTDAHEGKDGLFPGGSAWLGALLPKRWARRAVTRNTLRRQIYAVAAESPGLRSGAMVVRLHSAFDRKAFPSATSAALKHTVRSELQTLFAKVPHV
jgi:ribonuclease P protein component